MATTIKANVETHLRKALTSGGDGAALNPYDLDSMLHEELLKLQPLAELMSILPAGGKTHEYSVRSSHPGAWFEGETTPANPTNSVYARPTVQTKIQRIWGSVTGFAQAVDDAFIDALATELTGSVEGMSDILEYGVLWGAASGESKWTGDQYQFTGIVPRVFWDAPGNVVDGGGDKIALGDLDEALALAAGFRGVRGDPKLWAMSLRMRQVTDGLQTAVQLPLTQAELADGKIVMMTYAGIPIFESDFVAPQSGATTSPAVTATPATGGSLPDDEYFYVISSVTTYGEQVAGGEDSGITATTNNSNDLTWTPDANAHLYMIFRGLTTGNANLQLLDIIPAHTYDAAGTVNGTVAAYTDDGSRTPKAVKPLSTGEEQIVLMNINPDRGAAFLGLVDEMGRPISTMFRFVELARVKDTYDYMLKGYLAQRLVHPNLVSVIRHVKLA